MLTPQAGLTPAQRGDKPGPQQERERAGCHRAARPAQQLMSTALPWDRDISAGM